MKYIVTYDLADGAYDLAMQHYPAHRARLDEFHRRGVLLMVGTFADEPVGAMAVFTTREAADESHTATAFLLLSTSRMIIGVKMSCIASSIFPPGTTSVLARDMNESCSIESR